MPETVEKLTLLQQLRAKRTEELNAVASMIEARSDVRSAFEAREASQDAKPSDDERSAHVVAEEQFGKEFDRREADIKELDRRISEQEIIEARRQDAAAASRGTVSVTITDEPHTYRKDNAHEISYFRDLCHTDSKVAQYMTRTNSTEAMERLHRHAKETEDWLPKRAQKRERLAEERIDRAEKEFRGSFNPMLGIERRGFEASPFERRVNPNRTDGQGGYFVPPKWLIDEFIPLLRAGRVLSNLVRNMPLPEGTDSINIPKLSVGTLIGIQGQDAGPVPSQDIQDTSVQANVKTLAGQEDVAIQWIEQSPGQIVDRVITEDLLADYNLRLELQVQQGNGQNSASLNGGQVLGFYPRTNWANTNHVTWTSSTPLGGGFLAVLNANWSQIAQNRYDVSNVHHLMHTRRAAWYYSALDGASGTAGRPLVGADGFGPFNVAALEDVPVPAEGHIGRTKLGPHMYASALVPSTDNGSGSLTSNQDVVISAKMDDAWLLEGDMRTRVLPEVLSGTLEVRYQLYNFLAFLVRYGQSISIADGTGFAPPQSAFDSSVKF